MSGNNLFSGTWAEAQALKDDLFRRAGIGEITGDEADAQAISQGLGSLSHKPGPDEFRPESLTHWTLPMAVAWIAYLDLDQVREWSASYREACFDWRWERWQSGVDGPIHEGCHLQERSKPTLSRLSLSSIIDPAEDGEPLAMSVGEARKALWVALHEGFFAASGIDIETARRVEIPALDWHELVPVETHEVDEVRRGPLGGGYRDVLFPSAALQGFWRRKPEGQFRLPALGPPTGDGYMPLYFGAQWIATKGGTFDFDPSDLAVWRLAYAELLAAIASEKVRVTGIHNGVREPVPGFKFADCQVDYPYAEAPTELYFSTELYLKSSPFIDDEHWRGGFDDSLMNRWSQHWSRLMVLKSDLLFLWPFENEPVSTGAPGRPTSMHLVSQELEDRATRGELETTLKEQSRVLANWLKVTHPNYPSTTAKTIENRIRFQFRTLREHHPK